MKCFEILRIWHRCTVADVCSANMRKHAMGTASGANNARAAWRSVANLLRVPAVLLIWLSAEASGSTVVLDGAEYTSPEKPFGDVNDGTTTQWECCWAGQIGAIEDVSAPSDPIDASPIDYTVSEDATSSQIQVLFPVNAKRLEKYGYPRDSRFLHVSRYATVFFEISKTRGRESP